VTDQKPPRAKSIAAEAPDFGPVVRRIAHKHVSLGIKPSEYPIVGHHLMWAN
jgi:nitric oxide dioxygenase